MILAVVAFMAPSASQVLANVQQHYATKPQLTLEFSERNTNATFGSTTTSEGTFLFSRPGLFRIDYLAPSRRPHATLIFDGSTSWWIDHRAQQITARCSSGPFFEIGDFLAGGNLATRFDLAFAADTLILTPKQPSTSVQSVSLVIDPRTWEVKELTIVDPTGNIEAFSLTGTSARPIPPTLFLFRPARLPTYKLVLTPSPCLPPPPASPGPSATQGGSGATP